MTQKELIITLAGKSRSIKGDLKKEMFEFHNSMVGKSKYIRKEENPNTNCGSCIQRVLKAVFNWYHYDESSPNYEEIEYTGRLGISNIPIYKKVK